MALGVQGWVPGYVQYLPDPLKWSCHTEHAAEIAAEIELAMHVMYVPSSNRTVKIL